MRILKYALKNTARNPFLSFSSILVIGLMLFFVDVLFFVRFITLSLIDNVNSRLSITLNLRSEFTENRSEVLDCMNALKRADPSISVRYVSASEAFKILQTRDPELSKVIESDKDNPLPSSIIVQDVPVMSYEKVHKVVKQYRNVIMYDDETGSKSLWDYSLQYKKIQALTDVLLTIQVGIFFIVGLFIFSVFIIVYNTIGNFVFFFRSEIRIIQLVWGDSFFIYGPFAIQGLLYAWLWWAISLGVFYIAIKQINFALLSDFPVFVDSFLVGHIPFFLTELVGAILVWVFAGILSAYQFTPKNSLE